MKSGSGNPETSILDFGLSRGRGRLSNEVYIYHILVRKNVALLIYVRFSSADFRFPIPISPFTVTAIITGIIKIEFMVFGALENRRGHR